MKPSWGFVFLEDVIKWQVSGVVREAGLLAGVPPGIQHDLDHVEMEVLSAAFYCEQES